MAYTAISNPEIVVGKALKQELFQKIADNFTDHETRLALAIAGGRNIEIFNLDFRIGSYASTINGVLYHEALQNFTLIECAIQIFDLGGISSGILSVDVKKNTTPNNTGMTTVFTVHPSINYTTAVAYQRDTGTFDLASQSVLKGEILRLDVTSLPVGLGSFRIIMIGEV
jgi:hypothetical protein